MPPLRRATWKLRWRLAARLAEVPDFDRYPLVNTRTVRNVELEGERLLAEDRHTPIEGHRNESGMRIGRGRDDGRSGRVEGFVGAPCDTTPDRVGGLARPSRVDVGDDDLRDVRLAGDEPAVELADPAGSKEGDPHVLLPVVGDPSR